MSDYYYYYYNYFVLVFGCYFVIFAHHMYPTDLLERNVVERGAEFNEAIQKQLACH